MAHYVEVNDCLVLDVDSIVAIGENDGYAFVALRGGLEYDLSTGDLENLKEFLYSYRGFPIFDLNNKRIEATDTDNG